MVQNKHQKSKPKKQPPAKKFGKHVDLSEFRAQLDALGLKIIQVTADGNCFFRALADQLDGSEEEHDKYRNMIVQYLMRNREMFEPFVEDGVPFDEYCQSMENDGTWAGNMELQAASLVTCNNICIHRHMSPRWYIRNFDHGARMIHLSYHDGEHYNSVRLKEDPCDGPAKPIFIKADINLTASSEVAKAAGSHLKSRASNYKCHEGAIKMVMASSSCNDAEKIEQVLLEIGGDVDAAIEFLIAEGESQETFNENDPLLDNTNNGYCMTRSSDKHEERRDCSNGKYAQEKKAGDSILSSKTDKKIPRNKVCPCGSKKKYKACCGTASGRACPKLVVDQEGDSKKGKKGKQGNVAAVTKNLSNGSDKLVADLGALYI